jgi:hypothetical protein
LCLNDSDTLAQINAHGLVELGGRSTPAVITAVDYFTQSLLICLTLAYFFLFTMHYFAIRWRRRRMKSRLAMKRETEALDCGGISNVYKEDIGKGRQW